MVDPRFGSASGDDLLLELPCYEEVPETWAPMGQLSV